MLGKRVVLGADGLPTSLGCGVAPAEATEALAAPVRTDLGLLGASQRSSF